jgi:hypothetical protein
MSARRLAILLACLVAGAAALLLIGPGIERRRDLLGLLGATYLTCWLVVFAASRIPLREMGGRFVLVSASLAATWAGCEALTLAGVLDARTLFRARAHQPWLEPGNVFDPELLWRRRAHLHVSGFRRKGNTAEAWSLPAAGPGYRYDLSYDSNGFRNERDLDRADVVVLGDSYVEAVETPSAQLFTTLLAGSSGQVVANLGLSGYGPQQEAATLRRHGAALHPSTVFWVFYEGNDLKDARVYEELRGELARGLRTKPSRAERLLATNVLDALYRLVCHPPPSAQAEKRYGTFTGADKPPVRVYFVDPCDALTEQDEEGLAIFGRALREGYEIARREGFRLVLVYAPSKFRVLADATAFPPQTECLDWERNDLPRRVRALVAESSPNGAFLDLTAALAAPVAAGRLTFLPDDTHWTPLGHEVVAQAILDFLRDEPATTVSPVPTAAR